MKRSEINCYIKDAKAFFESMNFALPPFACWSPREWACKDAEYDEIRNNQLGWDITDFGKGDFLKCGLLLFTVRNGNYNTPTSSKTYAEKIMVVRENQVTPFHFHWNKMEDIINRGGGDLLIKVFNADKNEGFDKSPVTVQVDGRHYKVDAGTVIRLAKGESITLPARQYHSFWAEGSKTMVGEVSKTNDDKNDNRFYEPAGRFPEIKEDEEPLFLLVNEY